MFKNLMKKEEENRKKARSIGGPEVVAQVPTVYQPDDPDKVDEGEDYIF